MASNTKYKLGDFDLRKMVKMIKTYPWLMEKYELLIKRYKKHLNYHYNEFILAFIYLFTIRKNKELEMEYKKQPTTKEDPTRLEKEDLGFVEETTTSVSSGSYSQPAMWAKNKENHTFSKSAGKNFTKNGQAVKLQECECQNKKQDVISREILHDSQLEEEYDEDNYGNISDMKFSEYYDKLGEASAKHPSMTNLGKVKKANKENFNGYKKSDLDKKTKELSFDKDTLALKDIKKRNNTKEQDDLLRQQRGVGVESFVSDLEEDKETEKRFKKQMKSPNTDVDRYKNREEYIKMKNKSKNSPMSNVAPVPVSESKDKDIILEKYHRIVSYKSK